MSVFDSNSYYRFSNVLSPGNTLSAGVGQDSGGAINMTVVEVFSSSENWQLYYQQGRYFLRNWDYGGGWQLGLDEASRSVPKLLKRSGSLGQQWTLTQDGTKWTFTNGLLGNDSFLALGGKNTIPAMQPSSAGADWDVQINVSAGSPQDRKMLEDVDDFEDPPVSSTSSTSSSTTVPTSKAVSSTAGPTPPTAAGTRPVQGSASTSGPSAGAIAGIAVGGVLVLALCGLAVFFFFWRRRKPQRNPYSHQLSSELGATEKLVEVEAPVSYKHMAEPVQPVRPVEIG